MSVHFWVEELADAFWAAAGCEEEFPRTLRRSVIRALPLAVVSLPRLSLLAVRDWFVGRGLAFPCAGPERGLRACLVAREGFGYVFLDGSDAEDEQRFSLAHEVAHFLRHYWQPRQRASRRLGEGVLEVFDGKRPPTLAESFHALLAGVPVGFHVHLMGREPGGGKAAAEREADRLAYELLAPAEAAEARARAVRAEPDRETVEGVLRGYFGLPPAHAASYAALLCPEVPHDPLLGRLGIVR